MSAADAAVAQVALNFEDGVTRFIACLPGETIADAAYRNGVNVPLDCRDGVCGTCKSLCESGSVEMTDYLDDALSAAEASAGYVLTCKAKPRSDCVVRIASTSTVCRAVDQTIHTARIACVEQLSASTIRLELEGPAIERLRFLPGQYANLQVPGSDETRAYSFTSQNDDGRVGFLIRNVPGGKMSAALSGELRAGDEMRYRAPFGSFYLRKIDRPLLMIAGGTGLAPFLAMLQRMAGMAIPVSAHLVYGVNREADLVELDRLDAYKALIAGFDYTACVVETAAGGRLRGLVTDHLRSEHFRDGEADVYLCGPPPMVAAVQRFIEERQLSPAALYCEKFLPTG